MNNQGRRPIYDALLNIGRFDRSITADTLERYPIIVNAPAVRRRALDASDQPSCAAAAHELLTELIDELRQDATTHTVVRAALGIHRSYKGVDITVREKELEDTQGVSSRVFKYRRKQAYLFLEAALLGDPSEAPPNANMSASQTNSHPKIVAWEQPVRALAESLLDLYFPLITTLAALEINLTIDNTDFPRGFRGYTVIAFEAFQAAASLVCTYRFGMWPKHLECLSAHLGEDIAKTLIEDTTYVADGCLCVTPEGNVVLHAALTGATSFETPPANDIYAAWLYSWYFLWRPPRITGVDNDFTPNRPAISKIAKQAGEVAVVAAEHGAITEPLIQTRRAQAHKLLSFSYNFDEFAPLINGKSLRQYADTFLDKQLLRMASGS